MLEGKVVVYSQKASKATSFVMTLASFFPGALTFKYSGSEKIKKCLKAWNQIGLPLKVFHKDFAFMPLATLQDMNQLEKSKGLFVGATNVLISTTPALKTDLVIDLDENRFDFKPTELAKIAKNHTMSDKRWLASVSKEVQGMEHGISKKEQVEWDSIPMGDGQMLNSLDYIDSFIRSKFLGYFERMLTHIAFRRKMLSGEIEIYMSDELKSSESDGEEEKEGNLEEWDLIDDHKQRKSKESKRAMEEESEKTPVKEEEEKVENEIEEKENDEEKPKEIKEKEEVDSEP